MPTLALRLAPGLVALFLSCLILFPGGAEAQESDVPRILIVDAQRVIRESDAARLLQQGIESRRQVLQQQLVERQESMRLEEQSLIDRRDSLGEAAFAEERRQFQQKIATLQRQVQTQRNRLDQLYANGFSEVQRALEAVVMALAEERQADLVLTKSAAIYLKEELDVTELALQRLNQALPEVTLPGIEDRPLGDGNGDEMQEPDAQGSGG